MMGHKICLFGEIWKIISELYTFLLIWSSIVVYEIDIGTSVGSIQLYQRWGIGHGQRTT